MKKSNKGYSFVEIIIIIAIMAILAAGITIAIIRYLETSRQSVDVYHACLIRDALRCYPFPSNYQGKPVTYTDPETGDTEVYKRGWVYVDKDEIRCSDQSTALAMINAGLVYVPDDVAASIEDNEESSNRWFPNARTGEYYRKSDINEYVFKNQIYCRARTTWNTYQVDVYLDDGGNIIMGASASNESRTSDAGHSKDAEACAQFAKKLGLDNAFVTPIGNQYVDD